MSYREYVQISASFRIDYRERELAKNEVSNISFNRSTKLRIFDEQLDYALHLVSKTDTKPRNI